MREGLDGKARFSERVAAYTQSRPSYPSRLYDLLLEGHGAETSKIAELGSGTGIFTAGLVERGYAVAAVEPNGPMRAAAEESLSKWPRFESIAGSAEATTLEAGSVDLVVAAQSFHWFDFERTRAEVRRILGPNGSVGWVWNSRRVSGSQFSEAYEAFLERWATDYLAVRKTYRVRDRLHTFFPESALERQALENHQHLDRAAFRSRVLSASYIPAEDHPSHEPMLAALEELFDTHQQDGMVRLEMDAELFMQRLRAGDES